MKFIPSRNFTVYSCLSFDEVKDTLGHQTKESLFNRNNSPFVGSVDEEHFKIYKLSYRKAGFYRRTGFYPITTGTRDVEDDHIIHIEQKLHPVTLAFFYIECAIGFILFLTAIILTLVAPQSIFMDLLFLPLVALCVLAGYISNRSFDRQAEHTKRELFKLIKAVQINHEITPITEDNLIF